MTLRAPTAAVLMPCIAAAAAHVAAWSAAGQTALWGLHHASFLPSWVPVALVAALAVAQMPPVAATTMPGLLALASQLRRWHRLTLPAMVLAVGLGMFLTLPMEHALLGDAAARLAEVAAERLPGSGFRPHANDTAVRHLVHHSIGVPLGWSPARSYAAISTAWGVVLLAAAWYLCGQLAAGRGASRFLLFAPLATSGYVLLFFGYIEAYSSVAALGILLLVTTLRYVQGRTGLWLPLLVWLVLAGHHALGALAGSCLVLAILRRHGLDRRLPATLSRRLSWMVPVVCGVAAWSFFLWVRPTSAIPLLTPYPHIPYTLLDPAHLADVVNFALLAALPAFVALAAAWICSAPTDPAPHAGHELVSAAALSTAILMFIVNPALGRLDWDLMAMHAPLWILAGAAALERILRQRPEALSYAGWSLLAISLFHTLPWIGLQQVPSRLVRAVEAMVAADGHQAGSRGLKLGLRFEGLGFPDAARRQYERAIEQDSGSALAFYNLGRVYDQKGDLERAVGYYERAAQLDSTLPKTWNNLGGTYLRQKRLVEALTQALPAYSRGLPATVPPIKIEAAVATAALDRGPLPEDLAAAFVGRGTWATIDVGGFGHAWIDLERLEGRIVLHPRLAERPDLVRSRLLDTVLLNLLIASGFGMLHATCLLRGGTALLVLGDHGSGKTTTALHAIESGRFDLVTDSMVFVDADPTGRPQLHGFPSVV